MSRRAVLLPARLVARAVLAGVRLSSAVASPSPLVAAVCLRVAASVWLAAVGHRSALQLRRDQGDASHVTC